MVTEIYNEMNVNELIEELRQREKVIKLIEQVLKNVEIIKGM